MPVFIILPDIFEDYQVIRIDDDSTFVATFYFKHLSSCKLCNSTFKMLKPTDYSTTSGALCHPWNAFVDQTYLIITPHTRRPRHKTMRATFKRYSSVRRMVLTVDADFNRFT